MPRPALTRAIAACGFILLASCGGGYGGDGGDNPPATLNISVAPETITLGDSATITWSSNARRCTASDAWTGEKPSDGSETVTPDAAGTLTFSMVCSGGGYGSSQTGSAVLEVEPARAAAVFRGEACCIESKSFEIAGLTDDAGDARLLALDTHLVGRAGQAPLAFAACADCLAGARQAKPRAFRLLSVATDAGVPSGAGSLEGSFSTQLANGYALTVTIDRSGSLSGVDSNGCMIEGRVNLRPGARVAAVSHRVTGCGSRDGHFDGLVAAVADEAGDTPGLLLSTSNESAAIGWRLSR
jgi:hypothetical protein